MNDGGSVRIPLNSYTFNLRPEHLIPRRPWLIRKFAMRGHITELVAGTAVGKSSFGLALAAHCAAGRDFGPFKISKPMRVGIISAEEDRDELERRLAAVAREFGFDAGTLRDIRIFTGNFCLAEANKAGKLNPTESYRLLLQDVANKQLDLLIADPLIELWQGSENDNSQIRQALGLLRDIARDCNMAVLVAHHVRKGTAIPGDIDAARGGSANGGLVRFCYTLCPMTIEEAGTLGIKPQEARGKSRLDRAKGSYLPPTTETDWFRFDSLTLDNGEDETGEPGDDVGVLKPWSPPTLFEGISVAAVNDCLDVINAGVLDDDGKPTGDRFTASKAGKSSAKWVGHVIIDCFDVSEEKAAKMAGVWIDNGLLYQKEYRNSNSKDVKGLFVDPEKRPNSHAKPF